jgi:hypothetical protein
MRPLPLRALLLALCLAVPASARAQANDACADATVIKRLPFTRTFAVDGATFSAAIRTRPAPATGRTSGSLRIAIITPEPPTGAVVTLTARKSVPRYRTPERLTELLRSSDPSPYGGSQGWLLAAATQTDKRTAFVQQSEARSCCSGATRRPWC